MKDKRVQQGTVLEIGKKYRQTIPYLGMVTNTEGNLKDNMQYKKWVKNQIKY